MYAYCHALACLYLCTCVYIVCLVCVAVSDQMLDGLAAIYTFYDPDLDKRSLGTFAVLLQISQAKKLGLPFVYLGYWIDGCKKMAYKGSFQPLELFVDGRWQLQKTQRSQSLDTQQIVNLLNP